MPKRGSMNGFKTLLETGCASSIEIAKIDSLLDSPERNLRNTVSTTAATCLAKSIFSSALMRWKC